MFLLSILLTLRQAQGRQRRGIKKSPPLPNEGEDWGEGGVVNELLNPYRDDKTINTNFDKLNHEIAHVALPDAHRKKERPTSAGLSDVTPAGGKEE